MKFFQKKSKYPFIFFTVCAIFLSAAIPSLSVDAAPRLQPTEENIVIVIDPGHGGENDGTVAAIPPMKEGTKEKDMTMITAKAMYEELCKYDNVEVYLTRTDDSNLSLKERAQFAADVNADFLFSLHYNASLNHELFGSEIWITKQPPYDAYSYQFGVVQMQTMQDMGLLLRGIKTKLNEENLDYYGIIREAVALEVPAVIVEHCHVDELHDVPFCEGEEQWKAFGKADATSVAKYFGLSSSALAVDYSKESTNLANVSTSTKVQHVLEDKTAPDVCQMELVNADYDTGEVSVSVSAADYDTVLLYYDYSIDGGQTFTPREPWPDTDVINGTYPDIITLSMQIPSGEMPAIVVRAYNPYDLFTESNCLSLGFFSYGEENDAEASLEENLDQNAETEKNDNLPGTTTFRPADSENILGKKDTDFGMFLMLCFIIAISIVVIVFISQAIHLARRRRRK